MRTIIGRVDTIGICVGGEALRVGVVAVHIKVGGGAGRRLAELVAWHNVAAEEGEMKG